MKKLMLVAVAALVLGGCSFCTSQPTSTTTPTTTTAEVHVQICPPYCGEPNPECASGYGCIGQPPDPTTGQCHGIDGWYVVNGICFRNMR